MFDDPKKELRRMEQALWEAEEEALLEQSGQEDDDLEELLQEQWLTEDALAQQENIPIRNHANNYGRRPGNFAPDIQRTVYDDEADVQDRAVTPAEPEKKGVGGLFLLLLLEILGILLVILWWVKWLSL